MGDPKKQRKQYETPTHPWRKDRIDRENELIKRYGLKNKREIWKAESRLRNFRRLARDLLGIDTEQSRIEEDQLLKKLQRLGLLADEVSLDAVLGLNIEDILDRRLQTQIYKLGLAKTPSQARQLVVHRQIRVNNRIMKAPSYFVRTEDTITTVSA